jgi:hypothetical protein
MFQLSLAQGAFLLTQLQLIKSRIICTPTVSSLSQRSSGGNRNIIVGNYGAVRTGVQNASPLNVA